MRIQNSNNTSTITSRQNRCFFSSVDVLHCNALRMNCNEWKSSYVSASHTIEHLLESNCVQWLTIQKMNKLSHMLSYNRNAYPSNFRWKTAKREELVRFHWINYEPNRTTVTPIDWYVCVCVRILYRLSSFFRSIYRLYCDKCLYIDKHNCEKLIVIIWS